MSTGKRPDNDAGGVFSRPEPDPIGTVRVHPDDDPSRPEARRVIKRSNRTWTRLTCPAGSAPRPHEVGSWPRQSLHELAVVFDHVDTTSGAAHRDRWTKVRSAVLFGTEHRHTRPAARRAPRRVAPSFWEEAKAYCRAMHAAWDLVQYWSERNQKLAEEQGRETNGMGR